MKIFIFGAGKVGKVLGKVFKDRGHIITGCYNRSRERGEEAAKFIGDIQPYWEGKDLTTPLLESELLLISVKDDAIEEVSQKLCKGYGTIFKGKYIAHTSGSRGAFPTLSYFKAYGGIIGTIHPLYPFLNLDKGVEELKKVTFGISGEDKFILVAKSLVESIRGNWILVKDKKKNLYHTGAVIASNFIPLLYRLSSLLIQEACYNLEKNKLKDGLRALMETSLYNVFEGRDGIGLTGPILREDLTTIKAHIEVLNKEYPDLLPFYMEATLLLLKIAYDVGSISKEFKDKLIELFKK